MSLPLIHPERRLTETIQLPPADCPTAELPEYEPTATDLNAIERLDEDQLDAHLHRVTVLCAMEHRRLDHDYVLVDEHTPHDLWLRAAA